MADIELVIKIDEEQYEFIKQSMTIDKVKDYHALLYDICEHIANSTPLPKGHGRLIDADVLEKAWHEEFLKGMKMSAGMVNIFNDAQTIIEADKYMEGSE